jgi:hypothetical protein
MQDLTNYIAKVQLPLGDNCSQSVGTNYFDGSSGPVVGGASIINPDSPYEGKMFKGAAAYRTGHRTGNARIVRHPKRRGQVGMHKKNFSYESYLMNRPVVRRYSNAIDAVRNPETHPIATITGHNGGYSVEGKRGS